MKTFILLPFFLLCVIHPSKAQQDSIYPNKTCKVWISLKEEQKPMKAEQVVEL